MSITKELFETTAENGQTVLDRFVCPDKGGAEVVDTLPSIVSPDATDGSRRRTSAIWPSDRTHPERFTIAKVDAGIITNPLSRSFRNSSSINSAVFDTGPPRSLVSSSTL